jgi:phosphatidylglycerol:prolipoprotein diacylglycerol transferase
MAITGISIHPTQLYESFAETGIFIALMILRKYKSFDGQVMWMYVLLYSGARFIIEFFRGDPERGFILHGLSIAQGMSIILFAASLVFLVLMKKNKQAS